MAAGTVSYVDTTGNMDYLGMIASQIGRRLKEASDMASDERAFAEEQAELGGTSLEEAGIGRGYFFKRALGSRFGGDKIARTKGRLGVGGAGTNPTGDFKSRFRGGFDYKVTNEIQTATMPLTGALVSGLRGVEGGLVDISQSLNALAVGMNDLARAQEDVARQTIRNGAFMQAFLNHMQREGARQRARSEEAGLERGGRRRFGGFGGGGSGRGMINVTPSGTGGGGGGGNRQGALTSFLSSQLLGKKTGTQKLLAKASPKLGKKFGITTSKVTQNLPALPAAGQTAGALTKSADQAAIKLAGNRTIQKSFKRLGVSGSPNLIKNARTFGETSLAAVKTGGTALMEKSVGAVNRVKKMFGKTAATKMSNLPVDFFLDDPTDIMMANLGKNVDAIDALADASAMKGLGIKGGSDVLDATMRNMDNIRNADDAVKLYSNLRSGLLPEFGYKQFSEKEADAVLRGIIGDDNFSKWARKAKSPFKTAAKKTVAQKMLSGTDEVAKIGAKGAGKLGAKAVGRSILKKLPVIAGLAGIYFGIERALKGDLLGAGLEITSGILGATGVGGSAGLVIDGYLLGRDMGMMPMANGGLLSAATPVLAGEKGKEAFLPLDGAEGEIAGSVFGNATAQSLANFFFRGKGGSKRLENLRYNSDHPMGTDQPNPHPPGTFLHRNFERLREMNILDPDMQISMLSSAANSGDMANNLNQSSANTSMGTMMMPTTIINNNYAAANTGGSPADLTDPSFPADVNDFIASYSLASK